MKKILFYLVFLGLSSLSFAQVVSNGPGGFTWVDSPPTHNPGQNGAKFAVNRNTFIWYEHVSGTTWAASGDRIQTISGCSAPAYTPGNHNSRIVINGCATPELYAYTGSAWVKLNSGNTYTGGEGIDITGAVISLDTVNRLTFRTAPTLPGGVGTLRWNDTDGTLDLGLKGGNSTLQLGQEINTLVKHADNAGLTDGAVVYTVGSDGANKTVRLARADSETTSANTFGVMTESATGGNKGFCTTFGLVRNINTSTLTEGALVWLSATTAGAMTTTRPTAPNHAVQIGFCIRSHATQGVIFVSVQNGYELDELHNVSITSLGNGQVLSYDSIAGYWENSNPAAGVTWPLLAPDGDASAPSYAFANYPTAGMYYGDGMQIAADKITITTATKVDEPAEGLTVIAGASETRPGGNIYMESGASVDNQAGFFSLQAGNSTNGSGGQFSLLAGNGAQGGGFTASAGNGAIGGGFNLFAGNSSADFENGGTFYIRGGDGWYGGGVSLVGGNGTGEEAAGVSIIGGNAVTSGGSVSIIAGDGGTDGGSVFVVTGAGTNPGFFIIQNPYTPTSSADANGTDGSISWDSNFIYIKTATGWKRAALSSF